MTTKDPFYLRKGTELFPDINFIPNQTIVGGPDADSPQALTTIQNNKVFLQRFLASQRDNFQLSVARSTNGMMRTTDLDAYYSNVAGHERLLLIPHPNYPSGGSSSSEVPIVIPTPYLLVLYDDPLASTPNQAVAAFAMTDLDGQTLGSPVYTGASKGSNWTNTYIYASNQLSFGGTGVILTPINWKANSGTQTFMNISTTALTDTQHTTAPLGGGFYGGGEYPLMNSNGNTVWTLGGAFTLNNSKLTPTAGLGYNSQAFHIGPDGTYYTPSYDATPAEEAYTAGFIPNTGGDILTVQVYYIASTHQATYNIYVVSVTAGDYNLQTLNSDQQIGWSTASGTASTWTPAQFDYTTYGLYYHQGPQTCWQLGNSKPNISIPYPYGLFKNGVLTTDMTTYRIHSQAGWYYQGCGSQASLAPFLNVILPPSIPPAPTAPNTFIAESEQWFGTQPDNYSTIENYDSTGWNNAITYMNGLSVSVGGTASVSSDVVYQTTLSETFTAFGYTATGTQKYTATSANTAGATVTSAPWYSPPGTSVSDYNYAALSLIPFPPATLAGAYVSYTNGTASANDSHFATPQKVYDVAYYDAFYPWMHISNAKHYIQGYILQNAVTSVKTPYLFLDDKTDLLAQLIKQLKCQASDIRAVFMDIDLKTIQGLNNITASSIVGGGI